MKVFNAFLMTYSSLKGECIGNLDMIKIGEATGSWKDDSEMYQKIQGILIDVKSLMSIHMKKDIEEIKKLADLIEEP